MLTKMRKNILFTLGVLVVMSSCVNKDYDLTRPIDKTMNVGGLIEMPVPGESSYSYTLEEILMPKDASDGSGLLKKRDDGTFVLEVEPTAGLNENYTFAGIEADNYTKTVEYPENDYFYAPGPGVTWPEETSPVDTKVPLNLKISGIDSRVEAIREVELDAALNLSVVAPPEVHLSILKDFRFTLPENMYVDETRLQSFMRLERHNVIVITTDLTSSNSFSSTCYISKIDMSGLALENAAGKTNKDLVNKINAIGGSPVGLSGIDGGLIKAKKLSDGINDFGNVGEIVEVNTKIVTDNIKNGFIPVIATVATGCDGESPVYNINADTAAAEIAIALGAEKLILLTDIKGLMRDVKDEDSLISVVKLSEIETLKAEGIIKGGMIPKVDCCAQTVKNGVKRAHIIDGRLLHSILIEMLSDEGIGTMFTE